MKFFFQFLTPLLFIFGVMDEQDTSFSGGAMQCDPPTCAVLAREIEFVPFQGLDESYQVNTRLMWSFPRSRSDLSDCA